MLLYVGLNGVHGHPSDTVIEIAIVDKHGAVLLNTVCNPSIRIPLPTYRETGISNDMVQNARQSADVISDALRLVSGHTLVMYDAYTDVKYLPGIKGHAAELVDCSHKFSAWYSAQGSYGTNNLQGLATAAECCAFETPSARPNSALWKALATRHVWLTLPILTATRSLELI